MIAGIVAGIGLGKLSEEVLEARGEQESIINDEEDQVGWCPEMDNEE